MPGRRGEKSEPREKARKKARAWEREKKLIAAPDSSIAPMDGDIIVVEADP